mmetsp:Transcript_112762/g.318766  ORF Transcript_112762/g.318766 Transcript_112762/m.318766 type:complete len:582 (-) Transcript_112762:209-1954(-)
MSLAEAFVAALRARAEALEEPVATAAKDAVRFVEERSEAVAKALGMFNVDGRLASGAALPASAYNDFYKFTMMPVVRAVEAARPGLRCTFSCNIRDADYRRRLVESATGRAGPELFSALEKELRTLTTRPFDRELFEQTIADNCLPSWSEEVLDAVCGPEGQPRMLADHVVIDPKACGPVTAGSAEDVTVQVFVAPDVKLNGEERVYIEASGPWHRVTWLETTLMQCVYDALLRDLMRNRHSVAYDPDNGAQCDASWYPKWLAEAFVRCAQSLASAKESGLLGSLFSGRRTGGLPLLMLQAMYLEEGFRDSTGKTKHLGVSSVTTHYWLKAAGIDAALIPRVAGTHAHELSMVIGALFGDYDDKAGVPLSQVVGHMLYFFLSRPGGDVQDPARKALMPMLPDTLGTRAFMTAASSLKVPRGVHKGQPVLSVIGAARQDSGPLPAFKGLMDEFKFEGAIMASEIEVAANLIEARDSGYTLFGAGGFFGDSEKAWSKDGKNLSMAIKVLRVYTGEQRSKHEPVKTGDPDGSGEGKFEADGLLSPDALQAVQERTKKMVAAELKVSVPDLQALFEAALGEILGS